MIVCIQGLGNLLIFLLGVALIAGGGGLTIFNIKGERGEEGDTVSSMGI